MKIAITGIRGIPSCYSGFETFAEELSARLVARGHEVTVYCRSNIIKSFKTGDTYNGVRLVVLPTIAHKYFDTIVHTSLAVLHALFGRYDVVLICNPANSALCFIPRLTGQKVVLNVDGLDRQRKKWGLLVKIWYLLGEYLATIFPNAIVTDARVMQEYYEKRFHKKSEMIAYGAEVKKVSSTEVIKKFSLEPDRYVLYVARLEPENNAHIVISAFKKVKTELKLVIVGDAPYAADYIKKLKQTQDKRIIFTGFVFGQGYQELQSHAFCYIQASEVGGTHPALIEAMGRGNCVIVNSTPENIEVAGVAAIFYKKNDPDDLAQKIQQFVDSPETRIPFQRKASERIQENYSWDVITDKYEALFKSLKKVS